MLIILPLNADKHMSAAVENLRRHASRSLHTTDKHHRASVQHVVYKLPQGSNKQVFTTVKLPSCDRILQLYSK